MEAPDDARFESAAQRFRGFFQELERAFVERADVLAQVALALLSREHVLVTGPPGTAKSQLATAVLGRIVDEETGRPSLFARQFTESTVQTDLVGPIDFKTLMATGRTEHFTDQGMLGAVHSFLDEVFDGRDMLLRTTLNVLHERELREGTRVTRGQIECALMTSNRYLAEVLEGSRETLLAFVDRVAFVAFVPRGFAAPDNLQRVLLAQMGGVRPPRLSALLTIQDLDVLQAAVDEVRVPDALCLAVGQLVDHLDVDLAQAARADPTFLATRYLSTRTAVRLGRVLRAACVYDAVVAGAARPAVAAWEALPWLRLSLLLSGPAASTVESLIARESDPRERRQLSILRTERELFDRALARLPRPAPEALAPASAEVAALREALRAAPEGSPDAVIDTAARLVAVSEAGREGVAEATEALDHAAARLAREAARAGWTAAVDADGDPLAGAAELARIADGLERARPASRPLARWLRGRAVAVLDDALSVGAPFDAAGDAPLARSEALLARADALREARDRLRAAGADLADVAASQRAFERAAARLEDALAALWDDALRGAMEVALSSPERDRLGAVLGALRPALERLDVVGARLVPWGRQGLALRRRVAGPRVEPLVLAAVARLDAGDRRALVAAVDGLLAALDGASLRGAVDPAALLAACAATVVRGDVAPQVAAAPSHDGYRALRAAEHRVPASWALAELAARLVPADADDPRAAIAAALDGLGADLRASIARADIARVRRAVELLDAWWGHASSGAERLAERGDAAALDAWSARLQEGRFLHVAWEERALARFAIECRVLAEAFPESAAEARALRESVEGIDRRVADTVRRVREARADLRWAELLAPAAKP